MTELNWMLSNDIRNKTIASVIKISIQNYTECSSQMQKSRKRRFTFYFWKINSVAEDMVVHLESSYKFYDNQNLLYRHGKAKMLKKKGKKVKKS